MKQQTHNPIVRRRAFTLMELLVVISIIGVLAAMIFPVAAGIKNKATIKKAQAQVRLVSQLIERYQTRFGYLPPDHPAEVARNSLYFELVGSTREGTVAPFSYTSLDGAAKISEVDCQTVFGTGAILNSTKSGAEESKPAEPFLKQLRPEQFYEYTSGGSTIRLLTCSIPWPQQAGEVLPGVPLVNPFRYLKNGTNNPGSFDLWVDIVVGGKSNRIGNWNSGTPQIIFNN